MDTKARELADSPGLALRRIALGAIAILALTGIPSLDYGVHWDEPAQLARARAAMREGSVLPDGKYNYPSFVFDITLAMAWGVRAFDALVLERPFDLSRARRGASEAEPLNPDRRAVLLLSRAACFLISSLGGLWLLWGLRPLDPVAAGLAALFYSTSWELYYHSRYLAPDAVMSQFVCATLACWTRYVFAGGNDKHLLGSAVALGAAASTKYTAIVLSPILAALVIERMRRDLREGAALHTSAARAVLPPCLAAAVFLLITPGALFETRELVAWVSFVGVHYRGSHGVEFGVTPYDVDAGLPYLTRLALYLTGSFPSVLTFGCIAVVSCFALGVVRLMAERQWQKLGLWLLPALLMAASFTLGFRVFVVRNFLHLAPFLCYVAAVGARYAISQRSPLLSRIAGGSIALVISFNAAFILRENSQIWRHEPLGTHLARYLEGRNEESVRLSCGARELLAPEARSAAASRDSHAASEYVFLLSELAKPGVKLSAWDAQRDQGLRAIGPAATNVNFYPTWKTPTLVRASAEFARRSGLENQLCW